MRPADVQSALEDSLSNMGLDYVDLYLVHVPMGVVKRDGDFEIDFWENGTVRVDYDTDIVAVWKVRQLNFLHRDGFKIFLLGAGNGTTS